MALVTINDMLASAIDNNNAKLAGELVDRLRGEGFNYDAILALAQKVRPNLTPEQWESLLYDSESSDE